MRPQLLRNDKGIFYDASATAGQYFREMWLGRSVAACDFDNDGDVDLAVGHLNRPYVLLRNDTQVEFRPFLGLKLTTTSRTSAVGGRVVLHTDQRDIVHAISTGASYLAASDSRLLLSWPEAESIQEIEVRWPSGRIDRWKDLDIRHYWVLNEGCAPSKLETSHW